MMSTKRNNQITVFMAAYNAAPYIAKAIQSILDQTFKDFELLIVNDGSSDNTVEIIKGFSDSRIRLIENPKNMGLAYTRNLALTEVKGDFMAILDSDDIAFSNRLEIQLQHFLNNSNLAVLGACALVIDKDGNRTGQTMIPICDSAKLHAGLLFYNSFIHSSVMLRMSSFRTVNGYSNHPIAEDYSLFSKLALKYQVANLNEYLVEYRIHGENISFKKKQILETVHYDILSYQMEKLFVSIADVNLDILLNPINGSKYSIEDYYQLYKKIIFQNRIKKQYPQNELELLLIKNWYAIIMEKGGVKTLILYFRTPLYNMKLSEFKHLRRVFKKTLKHLIKH